MKWDSSAAGHVTAQESYDETARRELNEELGVSVPLQKILKLPAAQRTDHEFIWLYQGVVAGDLAPNKCEIGAFFPRAIVDGWTLARPEDFAPGFLECWKVYRRKNRAVPPRLLSTNFLRGKRRWIVRLNFRAARRAPSFPP